MQICGLVLAAGAGRRLGRPKALMRDAAGTPWVELAVRALRGAGCSEVTVILGADADTAREFVPAGALVAVAHDWQQGLSASLGVALAAAAAGNAEAALVTLVDLPALPVAVARRLAAEPVTPATLRQAVFAGRPGHPVLLGREHWQAVADSVTGDRGARPYLRAHGAREVECGDLWNGEDVDRLEGPG